MSKQLTTIVTYFDENNNTLLEFRDVAVIIPGINDRIRINTATYVVKSIDHTFKGKQNIVHHINIYMQDYFNSIMV